MTIVRTTAEAEVRAIHRAQHRARKFADQARMATKERNAAIVELAGLGHSYRDIAPLVGLHYTVVGVIVRRDREARVVSTEAP